MDFNKKYTILQITFAVVGMCSNIFLYFFKSSLITLISFNIFLFIVFLFFQFFMCKFAAKYIQTKIIEEQNKKETEFQRSVKNIYDEHIFSITHELRSPLAVITASTNNQYNILKGVYNSLSSDMQEEHKMQFKDVKTQIEYIRHQSEIIEKFISSISEHASYVADDKNDKKVINLHKFLQSVIMNSRSYSRNMKLFQNRIQFGDMIGSDFMGIYADVSPHDLSRILINIMSNAADAVMSAYKQKKESNSDWNPNLKIRCIRTDSIYNNFILTNDFLRLNCEDKKIGQPFYIIIEDNGPGISEINLEKIFQYGFTTKKDTKQNKHYGLGLYLSILLANKNNLSLYVRSNKNGTMFAIGIPRTSLSVKNESDEESDSFTKQQLSDDSKFLYSKYKLDEKETGLYSAIKHPIDS